MGIETGLGPLDTLIFGSSYDADSHNGLRNRGFELGDVVLIRGEPGSGKTTLALQIASNIYHQKPDRRIRYVALEESVGEEERRSGYEFCSKPFMDNVDWFGRDRLERQIEELSVSKKGVTAHMSDDVANVIKLMEFVGPLGKAIAATLAIAAKPVLQGVFQAMTSLVKTKNDEKGQPPTLLVIDSLGALMNILTNAFPSEKPRLLFNEFCRHMRSSLGQGEGAKTAAPIIIIIGEHHFGDHQVDKFFPESYFCDVELVLRPEPVRMPRDSSAADKIALGYHLGAVVEPDAKHIETRSFCRVVKSRYSRNQSRRCAYDIEQRRGIRFFETYPGDGKLMLFAENEQQRAAWGSFFQRDLTDAYPALRHETFTMAGLDTVYESSRRLLQMPLRTDMLLSSLDSYWVLGYRDYRLKTRINENFFRRMRRVRKEEWAETLGGVGGARTPASSWACVLYPHFINELVHFAMCRLNKHLYEGTRAELARRPRPTRARPFEHQQGRIKILDGYIKTLEDELLARRDDFVDRYTWLCNYLLDAKPEDVLPNDKPPLHPPPLNLPPPDDSPVEDILPRRDLRETFLCPLPRSAVMLFGQYNADLLPFLAREDMHQYEKGEDHWLCVPYDANIGLFVTRADRLEELLNTFNPQEYRDAYRALKQAEGEVLADAEQHVERLMPGATDAEVQALRRKFADARKVCADQADAPPPPLPPFNEIIAATLRLTWDQIVCLCVVGKRTFGIETRNFDTLMAMFLELVWNCGGKFEVDGRYQVRDKANQLVPLIRALHYFRALFSLAKTDQHATIDPANFHERTGAEPRVYGDWLFGRYWYSTLVDALTATRPTGGRGDAAGGTSEPASVRSEPSPRKPEQGARYVWESAGEKVRIEIVQMPRGTKDVMHYACAGEWSFALLAGSENVALACDLISNLMGSLKVTQRGLQGACLPTVNQFYRRYDSERCIPATIRSDTDIHMPQMTFGDLGLRYMGVKKGERASEGRGIFRQAIFDYRHCAREIFGELLRLKNVGYVAEPSADDVNPAGPVVGAAINMLRGIEDLGGRYIFIRDTFRQDVAIVSQNGTDGHEIWKKKPWREVRVDVGRGRKGFLGDEELDLVNVSRSGCCLEGGTERAIGSPIGITIAGEGYAGTIARRNDGRTGVRFDQVCSYAMFGAMLSALSPPADRPAAAPRADF